jgi:acyl phosphate:glycerol-3-phosphate acyltransferase
MIIDVAKSWLATMLPVYFNLAEPGTALITNIQILTGVIAIIGHIFPVFAGFRGGKGVACVFGALLALQPLLTLCCFGVFIFVLLITGIVSVSSMSAGIAFPVLLFLFFPTPSVVFKLFSVLVAVVLLITHRKNIGRLLKGEESKLIKLGKKDKTGN